MRIRKGDTVTLRKAVVRTVLMNGEIEICFPPKNLHELNHERGVFINIKPEYVESVDPRPLQPGKARSVVNSNFEVEVIAVHSDGLCWIRRGQEDQIRRSVNFENIDD